MFTKSRCGALPLMLLCEAVTAFAGQAPRQAQASRPETPESSAHVAAAKEMAGSDPILTAPFNFYCIAANTRINSPQAPILQPLKLFDNLYILGNSETPVYALTTPEGIILINSGYPDTGESVVAQGLKDLGLNPAEVKLILLTHGHSDHFGGSPYFQDHFGTKVGTADWDLIYPKRAPPNQANANIVKPKKDIALQEGRPVKFGGVNVTVVATPGHTPGSVAFIFPVKDKGRTHIVGTVGGAVLGLDYLTTEQLKMYLQSVAHYLVTAKKFHVDVEIQEHPLFDGTAEKLSRLRAEKSGESNPFIIGTDKTVQFWSVISECFQASIARREADPK
jgi:metallo-beta-lactamase class B